MKRKVLIAVYIILILITLKLVYSNVVNSILISKYNKGEYSEEQAKALTILNFPQSYVAYYNYGDILYQKGEYEEAIKQYEKALKGNPPEDRECSIRINYALAVCETVKVNEKDQESIKSAIETYENAINILTEKGCANKNDNNGHSQKAEKLKRDIQNEIDRLKKLLKDDGNTGQEEQPEENNKSEEEVESIEEKIQNIKEEAIKDQRETENRFNHSDRDYNMEDKNW